MVRIGSCVVELWSCEWRNFGDFSVCVQKAGSNTVPGLVRCCSAAFVIDINTIHLLSSFLFLCSRELYPVLRAGRTDARVRTLAAMLL